MLTDSRGPAYRIETARLVLRCCDPSDAPALTRTIRANQEWLAPWLPWAVDPMDESAQRQRLRRVRSEFDSNKDLGFVVLDPASGQLVGAVGLHRRGLEHEREISYWVDRELAGRGYCSEFTAALARIAFEVEGVHRVQICCDPENVASNRVAEKLGFVREGTLRQRLAFPDGRFVDTLTWGLLAPEFLNSECARLSEGVRAFDVVGEELS